MKTPKGIQIIAVLSLLYGLGIIVLSSVTSGYIGSSNSRIVSFWFIIFGIMAIVASFELNKLVKNRGLYLALGSLFGNLLLFLFLIYSDIVNLVIMDGLNDSYNTMVLINYAIPVVIIIIIIIYLYSKRKIFT